MIKRISLSIVLAALAGAAHAQEWGDLEGTFVYKGMPPTPTKLQITKDPEYCGKHNLVDESIVVNKQNAGIEYVVVFLADMGKPRIHPDYAKSEKDEVKIVCERIMAVIQKIEAWVQPGSQDLAILIFDRHRVRLVRTDLLASGEA